MTIPTTGETSANVWYRVYLTVRDAAGLTHTVQRDIFPRKVSLTLATSPAGLQLRLDGQPVATPLTFDAVVGIDRSLEAPTPAGVGWNDLRIRVVVRRRRRDPHDQDARLEHDLYGHVPNRRQRRRGYGAVRDLLQQHGLHGDDGVAD